MKFATAVTDDYVPGLLALIKSIEENGKIDFSFAVLKLSDISNKNLNLLESLDTKVELFELDDLGKFEFDKNLMEMQKRYQHLKKLLVYNLPYDEKMCLIDADMLCLNDISNIENFSPISAGLNNGRVYPKTIFDRPMFNTGLMIFKPKKESFKEIQKFALDQKDKIWYGDQAILNRFYYKKYPENVNILGNNWNTLISIKRFNKRLWKDVKKEGIKFLHFTLVQPWTHLCFKDLMYKFFFEKRELYKKCNFIYNNLAFYEEIKMWKNYYHKAIQEV